MGEDRDIYIAQKQAEVRKLEYVIEELELKVKLEQQWVEAHRCLSKSIRDDNFRLSEINHELKHNIKKNERIIRKYMIQKITTVTTFTLICALIAWIFTIII